MSCVTAHYAHAHQTARAVVEWLRQNNPRTQSDWFEERHEKAMEYVRDNSEVRRHVEALVIRGLVGDAANVITQIEDTIRNVEDFRHGRYFDGVLRVTHQVSSLFIDAAVPGSGAATDIMSLSAAVGTAYTYGFFWGN